MDQTSETITTTHGAAVSGPDQRRLGRGQRETTVRPVPVVMDRVLPQDSLEVAPAEDQEMVEALPAQGSHPSLGERVGLRCPDRCADDSDALGPEHLVEWTGELGISVADQEADVSKPLPHM